MMIAEVIDDFTIANERFLIIWDESRSLKSSFEVPLDAPLAVGDSLRLVPTGARDTYTVSRFSHASAAHAPLGELAPPSAGGVIATCVSVGAL